MSMISILKNTSSTHDAHENQVPAMLLKRRQKALLLNALTIFFISVATLIAINMITSCQETQIIPVAIRDISKGTLIKQDDLSYVNVPKNSVFNHVINKDLIKSQPAISNMVCLSLLVRLRNKQKFHQDSQRFQ